MLHLWYFLKKKKKLGKFFPQVSPQVIKWTDCSKIVSSVEREYFVKFYIKIVWIFVKLDDTIKCLDTSLITGSLGSIILATGGLPNFLINSVGHIV